MPASGTENIARPVASVGTYTHGVRVGTIHHDMYAVNKNIIQNRKMFVNEKQPNLVQNSPKI